MARRSSAERTQLADTLDLTRKTVRRVRPEGADVGAFGKSLGKEAVNGLTDGVMEATRKTSPNGVMTLDRKSVVTAVGEM
ncbi:hypothetical protein VQ042_15980 [Aurantimonas sp. A2-1-M11]|uniref:hypothetical protein n=1 Tax=Aurantimonas sp. A2-1-M11 TaxID=3113712 RepID=UPI002F94ED69